jgi:hypothetical protein
MNFKFEGWECKAAILRWDPSGAVTWTVTCGRLRLDSLWDGDFGTAFLSKAWAGLGCH